MTIRISCDFLKETGDGLLSLNTLGARADIARLSQPLVAGTPIVLYDADEGDDGTPIWIVADATIVSLPDATLAARRVGECRYEPRSA